MNNSNDEDVVPATNAEEEIAPSNVANTPSAEVVAEEEDDEKENQNKLLSITTNNGAPSGKGWCGIFYDLF